MHPTSTAGSGSSPPTCAAWETANGRRIGTATKRRELAKDVSEIVDTLGIGVFHLAGHDWGAIVAQEVALLLPERVRRLAIMNIPVITNAAGNEEAVRITQAHGSISLWYQYFQQQPRLAEAMIPGNEETWIRYFFGKAGQEGKIPEEAIREYIRCYTIEGTPAAGANYYRTMKYDAQRWATLAGTKFPMPSLYIYGNQDSVIIPAYLNHIEECFDDLKIAEIRAEHFVQEQEPRAVATLLNGFFR